MRGYMIVGRKVALLEGLPLRGAALGRGKEAISGEAPAARGYMIDGRKMTFLEGLALHGAAGKRSTYASLCIENMWLPKIEKIPGACGAVDLADLQISAFRQ